MICSKCGYMMGAFDKECPRCHGKGVESPVRQPPPVQPPFQPQAPQNVWQQPQQQNQAPQPQWHQNTNSQFQNADNPVSIGLLLLYSFLSFVVPLAGVLFYFGLRNRSINQARIMMGCAICGFLVGCAMFAAPEPSASSVSGSLDTPSSVSAPSSPAVSASGNCFGDLCVENLSDTSGEFSRSVTGTVVNTGGSTYGYVQVEINLYDSSGAQVGSTLANVNNLEPYGRWNFDAIMTEENATSYKLKDITAW